jgi:hypothetical protein
MEKMVPWVLFPMRRFPASRDDNTATQAFAPGRKWYRSGEMHMQCNGTNNPVRLIYQPY